MTRPSLAERVRNKSAPPRDDGKANVTDLVKGFMTPIEPPMTVSLLKGASDPSWRISTLTTASYAVLRPLRTTGEEMLSDDEGPVTTMSGHDAPRTHHEFADVNWRTSIVVTAPVGVALTGTSPERLSPR